MQAKSKVFKSWIAMLLAITLMVGLLPITAFAAEQQTNTLFSSRVFIAREGGWVAADKSKAMDSPEAIKLRKHFDRFFANNLVGFNFTEQTTRIAIKPNEGSQLSLLVYNAETNSYKRLNFVRVDSNGFWIFDVPAGTTFPIQIVAANAAPGESLRSRGKGQKDPDAPRSSTISSNAQSYSDANNSSSGRDYNNTPESPTPPPTGGATPDSPFLNPNDTTGGEITRQQWISQLVNHAELSMYNTEIISSFSDVDEDNSHSWAIEIARQNNAISISDSDGNQFYPQRAATEAFAVISAVRALGFVYDDLADCYAIANDCGIFSGTPATTNLTSSQASAILDAVDRIVAPANIDPTAPQIVNFDDDVITLSMDDLVADYLFSESAGATSVHLKTTASSLVQVGDCIILPANDAFPGGLAQKIVSITPQGDGTVIIETTTPILDEVMGDGEINIQGTAEVDASLFTINDELTGEYNVEYAVSNSTFLFNNDLNAEYATSGVTASRISAFAAGRPNIKITDEYVEVEFSKELVNRVDANGKAKIYFPDVDYIVDLDWFLGIPVGVNQLRFALTNKVECEGEIEVVGSKNDIINGLELGRVPIPLGASGFTVDVVLFIGLSAKGTIAISYELETTAGVQYLNGHLRTINQCRSNVDFTPLEAELEFGPSLSAMLTLFSVFDLADVTASGGFGANASATIRNTENACIDGTAYVYLRITALRNSLAGDLLNLSFSKTIWDKNNSVWKKSLHFEGTPTNVGIVPECTFGDGGIVGIVKDAATGLPVNLFTISAIKTDGDGNAQEISGVASINGGFNIDSLPAGTYKVIVSAPNYRTFTRENILVRRNQTINIGAIQLVSSSAIDGSASGYITNSQNGNPVSGATVILYQGDGTSSPTGQTATTDSDGRYAFSGVVIGNYTIAVSLNGYSTGSRSIVVTQAGTANQNITLIPIGTGGDYDTSVDIGTYTQIGDLRIVLTWGDNPSDLDSHLCGPTRSGADRFHVYYANRYYNENNHVHTFLDHDDVTSYGPETTTVYDINSSGKYSFYVHDFTNGGSSSSYALSESDATARVYVKEATGQVNSNGEVLYRAKLIGTFYVPTEVQGTLWHVFDYNAATGLLTARNTMTVDTGSGNVGNRAAFSTDELPANADVDIEEQIDLDRIRREIIAK